MCITWLQTSATLLCQGDTAAYIMTHAYPCAWSPLAIPDANLAIKLPPIQAVVLVPCSKHPRPLVLS